MSASVPSRMAIETGVIGALWRRDMIRLFRERTRWLGVILQPMMFWVLLGVGMGDTFRLEGAADVDYLTFFFPGIIVMIVLFTTVFATMAVIEDRQQGFLQQLLVGPSSRGAMVAGKTAGVTTVALLQGALCLVAAPLAGFDLLGIDWFGLALSMTLGCIGLTGMSFAIAWKLGSTHAYHAIMAVVLIPLWMVSGAMFPPRGGWMDALMWADPMTWMVDGVRHALHGGEAPVALMSPAMSWGMLTLFAVVAFVAAATMARKSP
ncbi:MAG: ABC transporter permease [Myxococcota bacterium]|nr:ABC transporter permease [Myxococcota bacterium]